MTKQVGFMAERVDTGAAEFVWAASSVPYGSDFTVDDVLYRRPVPAGYLGRVVTCRGKDIDFSKGPVTMWTEPLQGRGAVHAKNYDETGFPVFTSNAELREYEARSKDSLRPVVWIK